MEIDAQQQQRKRIIVALDVSSENDALRLLGELDPRLCRVKIGKELFTACGPRLVTKVQQRGFEVFLDLKFHDIPNTVARAVEVAACELGAWMINVHASGGRAMLEASSRALRDSAGRQPLLVGVTVLTSLDDAALRELGHCHSASEQVLRLARMCEAAGLRGVVCSPAEVTMLRRELPRGFVLVTPGIRRPSEAQGDQKRVMGPAEALAAGADYLVVGRPITQASSPGAALDEYLAAIHGNSRDSD